MRNYLHLSLLTFLYIFVSCNEQAVKKHTISNSEDLEISYGIAESDTLWNKKSSRNELVTLNVLLMNGSESNQELVREFASLWSKYANIDFTFHTDPDALKSFDITVNISELEIGKGGDSYVGSQSRRYAKKDSASMNLYLLNKYSITNKKGIILHEFGHALGLRHEQSHPERTFTYDEEKIINNCVSKGNKASNCKESLVDPLTGNDYELSDYDSISIMHYPLSRELLIGEYDSNVIKRRGHLSLMDKLFIAKLYPGRAYEQDIITQHASLMDEIEQVEGFGNCEILTYLKADDGLTYFHHEIKNKVHPFGVRNILIEPSKQDVIVNMRHDEKCSKETFEEAFNDF